jgi:hypothetical protein
MAERSLEQEFDHLKGDLESLKKTLTKKGTRVFNNAISNATETGQEGLATLENQIIERPLASLLIAFAAGIVISKLTHR